jgi:hypothetical protein
LVNLSDAEEERVAALDEVMDDYVAKTSRDGVDPLKAQDLTAG